MLIKIEDNEAINLWPSLRMNVNKDWNKTLQLARFHGMYVICVSA